MLQMKRRSRDFSTLKSFVLLLSLWLLMEILPSIPQGVLHLSDSTKVEVWGKGGVFHIVPWHCMFLKSNLVNGFVTSGVMLSLLIQKVTLFFRIALARTQDFVCPVVSQVSWNVLESEALENKYPTCSQAHKMAVDPLGILASLINKKNLWCPSTIPFNVWVGCRGLVKLGGQTSTCEVIQKITYKLWSTAAKTYCAGCL